MPQKKIVDNLNNGMKHPPNYIGRDLITNNVETWLGNVGLSSEDIEQTIQRTRRGFRLNEEIPNIAYQDYLGCMLLLCLINDETHTDNLEEILNKDGEKAICLITKLVLAKRKGRDVKIDYERKVNVAFRPRRFLFHDNIWFIEGILSEGRNQESKKNPTI